MSRIGKQLVNIPQGVKAQIQGGYLMVEGPKGKLKLGLHRDVEVSIVDGKIHCVVKQSEHGPIRALHGLYRSMISNMVKGCFDGFRKQLNIVGVGYRAAAKDKQLELSLGYSHPIVYPLPEGITVKVEKQTTIIIEGADRQLVGQTAAEIRKFRKPEPYKGKGVQYSDEVVRRKAGKSAAASTSAS